MFKLIIFAAASAGMAYVSRASLPAPRSHGFYRFFAWELILALFLLNVDYWFRDPLSAHQIISWLMLIISAFLVVHGIHLLRKIGKPDNQRNEDAPTISFEKTTALVITGAFKYIRHPLYSSLLLFGWGTLLKDPSLPGLLLALALSVALFATARVEEGEMVARFGASYTAYMRDTKRFIPFVF